MPIDVRISAALAREIGRPRLTVEVASGATVAVLLETLARDYPTAAPLLATTVAMVGGQHVGRGHALAPGQQVALLIPVAGGMAR